MSFPPALATPDRRTPVQGIQSLVQNANQYKASLTFGLRSKKASSNAGARLS